MWLVSYGNPRYYRRRENNGFWTLVPLQGPLSAGSVMVNDFTCRILDLVESGKTLEDVLDIFRRESPEEDERKLRVDIYQAASRLKKYDLIDAGGFVENARILTQEREVVPGSLQPCPLGHIAALSQFLLGAFQENGSSWIQNVYTELPEGDSPPQIPTSPYDAERMAESQATGGEIYWAYVDEKGRISGGISATNYMLMAPVVTITSIAAQGEGEEMAALVTVMLSEFAEVLSVFGLNEKIRIISCPSAAPPQPNLTVFDEGLFSAMAQCRFRRTAAFARELEGDYDVEYYDRLL